MVDSHYELPVSFSVMRANASEVVEAHQLLDGLEEQHPQVVQRCQELAADRSYDDGKLICKVWDDWQALPIIDIRNCWKDGEASRLITGFENVVYDYRGTVSAAISITTGSLNGPTGRPLLGNPARPCLLIPLLFFTFRVYFLLRQ
ncbi:MAG: hypothetical protein ABSF77_12675 [Spirochaetia bacterium]